MVVCAKKGNIIRFNRNAHDTNIVHVIYYPSGNNKNQSSIEYVPVKSLTSRKPNGIQYKMLVKETKNIANRRLNLFILALV